MITCFSKGCTDSRLAGSMLFVLCASLENHRFILLSVTHASLVVVEWDKSKKKKLSHRLMVQMPSLLSAHKRKRKKEKRRVKKENKGKERKLCKEKGQAWFCAWVVLILWKIQANLIKNENKKKNNYYTVKDLFIQALIVYEYRILLYWYWIISFH